MRRPLPAALLLLLLASTMLSAGGPRPGQSRRLRLADLMTKSEYDRAGLAKLSEAERESLDEWLTAYTDRVAADAPARAGRVPEPPELVGKERGEICDTDRLPQGWLKVDDRWNPAKCRSPALIEYNVWVVERHAGKPVGAEMEVCSDTPTPAGWVEVSARWNPAACGHPAGIVDNVKRIKRVR